MDAKSFGQTAEAVAAKYYLKQGCRLLAHNYRTRQGELDLVLQQGEQIIIAEVKARGLGAIAPPAEAVNRAKQQRLLLAAARYLQQHGLTEQPVRFDVVEVTPAQEGYRVHCIRDAFQL